MRIFGCKAYVYIQKRKRQGNLIRAQLGILAGYARGNAFRVYIPNQDTAVISQDVRCDESVPVSSELLTVSGAVITIDKQGVEDYLFASTAEDSTATVETEMQDIQPNPPLPSSSTNTTEIHHTDRVSIPKDITNTPPVLSTPNDVSNNLDAVTYVPELRRSTRNTVAVLPQRYGFESAHLVLDSTLDANHSSLSSSFREAMDSPERDEWLGACTKSLAPSTNTTLGVYFNYRRVGKPLKQREFLTSNMILKATLYDEKHAS